MDCSVPILSSTTRGDANIGPLSSGQTVDIDTTNNDNCRTSTWKFTFPSLIGGILYTIKHQIGIYIKKILLFRLFRRRTFSFTNTRVHCNHHTAPAWLASSTCCFILYHSELNDSATTGRDGTEAQIWATAPLKANLYFTIATIHTIYLPGTL